MYTCKPCTQVYTRGRCISSLCFFARMSAAVISPCLMDFVWGLLELNTWHQRAPMPAGWGSQHFMRHVSAHPVFPHNPLPLQQVKVQHLLGPENFCHPVVWGYVDKWSMISESHWDFLLWQNTLTSVTFTSKGGVEWPWRTAGILSWEYCDMELSCCVACWKLCHLMNLSCGA